VSAPPPAAAPLIARDGWIATASDSNTGEPHPPGFAIDGAPATFWHSQWTPAAPLPHTLTLTFGGGTIKVSGLVCTPRQDGIPNG
jgi:F5/8 type C domain